MNPTDHPLAGRTAIITGGASGIGKAVATKLSSIGSTVHLFDLNDEAGTETASEISRATFHLVNVCAPSDCVEAIEEVSDLSGPVELLVNAAGILGEIASVETLDLDDWRRVMAVNVEGPLNTIRAALPDMYAQEYGRIVNVTSMASVFAAPNKSAYVASKHALAGLTKAVALEAAIHGVTCNAVAPTWVRTPFLEGQIGSLASQYGLSVEQVEREVMASTMAIGRLLEPQEVAAMIVVALESPFLTGSQIHIDGGLSAGGWNAPK